ncbi:MAG TPA: tRNA pseudouridine(13) synthase TruD [archaeon]|nr:tRNA pseudouridine(13) synthase TruD [archaeon]
MNHILSPEDFVVEEVIDPKFLRKFERGAEKVVYVKGPYTLYLLKKRNLTTEEALKIIAAKFKIPVASVGFAGLKDKFAVTSQYISIKGSFDGFAEKNISLEGVGKTNKHISIGNLIANKFSITLHNCDAGKIEKSFHSTKKMPNFFGPQRFGSKKNNHEIGKLIVDKKFAEALNMINASGGRYASLKHVEKRKLKFYINAYQSEIFNKKLEITTKTGKIKIPGFNVDELMLSCSGFEREAYVVPKNMACEKYGFAVKLAFTLPKGSYATVLINELLKD